MAGIGEPLMTLEIARRADMEGNIEEAARQYEAAIAAGAFSARVMLDLAILYWEAIDPGGRRRSKEFFDRAATRYRELLADALRRYPDNMEVRFWHDYVLWIDGMGSSFTVDQCRDMLRNPTSGGVPAFHLLALTMHKEGRAEAMELMNRVEEGRSSLDRYVRSILMNPLRGKSR
jgi:hypothetical protein